jgi:hypothetical protein
MVNFISIFTYIERLYFRYQSLEDLELQYTTYFLIILSGYTFFLLFLSYTPYLSPTHYLPNTSDTSIKF